MKKIFLSICLLLSILSISSCQNNDENNAELQNSKNKEILLNDWKEFTTIKPNYDFEAYHNSNPYLINDNGSNLFLYNASEGKIDCYGFEYWIINWNSREIYYKDYSLNWYITKDMIYKKTYFYYNSKSLDYISVKTNYDKTDYDYLQSEINLWNSIMPNLINAETVVFEEYEEIPSSDGKYTNYKGYYIDAKTYEKNYFHKIGDAVFLSLEKDSRMYYKMPNGYLKIKKQNTFGKVEIEEISEYNFVFYEENNGVFK